MKPTDESRFTVPADLEPEGIDAGTNLLVTGPSSSGARDVALRLALSELGPNEGVILVSADVGGRSLLRRAENVVGAVDRTRLGIVDCSGIDDEQQRFDEHCDPIDDPGDLLGIEMELSVLYETLVDRGYDDVRVGVFSVSSLLAHADLEQVARFVHMLTGRIIATADLGVFVADPSMQDDRTVDAIEQFCDGTVDVRTDGDDTEVRLRGLGGASTWTPFTPGSQDQRRRRS